MDQKPQSRGDKQDQEIAQLKAELKRAYRLIEHLRQQNTELQALIFNTNEPQSQQSTLLAKEEVLPASKRKARRYRSEDIFSFLSEFKFLALTTVVAALFIIIGLIITQRKTQPPLESSPQSSVIGTQKNNLSTSSLPPPSPVFPQPKLPPLPSPQIKPTSQELVYQYSPSPNLQKSPRLQTIVDKIVKLAKKEKLPISTLSISLIDVNSNQFAAYQEEKLRYPASVVKLFWMVALFGQFAAGKWQDTTSFNKDLSLMMKNSDNEAASRIVDKMTNTKSGLKLSEKDYKIWLQQRQWLNRFFQQADYQKIAISQKTFPIPSEKLSEPKGTDLKMRGNPQKPIRNKISTQQAARLMYEIMTGRTISQEYSQSMAELLQWDLTSEEWKNKDPNQGEFNPIRTFFGESLPTNIVFASKAGWTSNTRQEVAYIKTSDSKTAYILAVFAEDSSYAKNWKIFPEISRLVFNSMVAQNARN